MLICQVLLNVLIKAVGIQNSYFLDVSLDVDIPVVVSFDAVVHQVVVHVLHSFTIQLPYRCPLLFRVLYVFDAADFSEFDRSLNFDFITARDYIVLGVKYAFEWLVDQ